MLGDSKTFIHLATRLAICFSLAFASAALPGNQALAVDVVLADPLMEASPGLQHVPPEFDVACDRLWLINTRGLTNEACCADLDQPGLRFSQLCCNGRQSPASLEQYLASLRSDRPVAIYVHGNRMEHEDAIERGLYVYQGMKQYRRNSQPIDWVIWSWPSERDGILVHDVREKAERTDAQGLYLAWLLRMHVQASIPTALVGYSFGGRVVTGSLHALAGGALDRRVLPGETLTGASFDVGLIAPAIENDWMTRGGYHGLATQNIDRLTLLYNRRDAVLKRYWLLNRARNSVALGYSGPLTFANRADGTRMPLRSRDCSPTVGVQHDEKDYYNQSCRAGMEIATLVQDTTLLTP